MNKMEKYYTLSEIDETTNMIRASIKMTPRISMILGSGLGSLAESVQDPTFIDYQEIQIETIQ